MNLSPSEAILAYASPINNLVVASSFDLRDIKYDQNPPEAINVVMIATRIVVHVANFVPL